MDGFWRKENPLSRPSNEPRNVQLSVSGYTDYAIPAPHGINYAVYLITCCPHANHTIGWAGVH